MCVCSAASYLHVVMIKIDKIDKNTDILVFLIKDPHDDTLYEIKTQSDISVRVSQWFSDHSEPSIAVLRRLSLPAPLTEAFCLFGCSASRPWTASGVDAGVSTPGTARRSSAPLTYQPTLSVKITKAKRQTSRLHRDTT